MAYTPMPIVIPASPQHHYAGGRTYFIESYDGGYINIGASTACDVYYSNKKWWLWFKIAGNHRYYANAFETEEEARKELLKIIQEINH
jgi:hypothetical protein